MAVVLHVRVVPRARSNALSRDAAGYLRARLTAPPVEGAANRALIALLAQRLDVKRADLEIVRGTRGRDKHIAVHGCSASELARRLETLPASDVDKGVPRR